MAMKVFVSPCSLQLGYAVGILISISLGHQGLPSNVVCVIKHMGVILNQSASKSRAILYRCSR